MHNKVLESLFFISMVKYRTGQVNIITVCKNIIIANITGNLKNPKTWVIFHIQT